MSVKPQLDREPPASPRREMVLAAATRLFNRHSFAAITLETIAGELGITAGALYHHFESKEMLVFECFNRGLRIYREELARAAEAGLDGLEMVRRFIRGRLRPGEPRMVTFSDLDALPRAHREGVHEARADNVDRLRVIVERGVDDDSIAACDPLLTSAAVFAVLDWMPLWYSEHSYYSRQDAAETLDDILTHGVIRRDVAECLPPASRSFDALLTGSTAGDKRALKRDRLLRVATESFNQRGVVGSSLEHIATDAGVSRGAYYYHARDKNALLHLCVQRAYRVETELLEAMLEAAGPSLDALDGTIAFEFDLLRAVTAMHRSPRGPKISFHNVPFLTSTQRADVERLDEALVGRNRGRYDAAVANGFFRGLDTLFIQQVGAGLRNNIEAWRRLTAGYEPSTVADGFTRVFLFGLKPRPGGTGRDARSS